jgi:branched-chain amino acid transport system permease protein
MLLQQIINGLSIGSIYALMAVGYSLIYSLMNFTNFAHGVVVMLSAYVGYYSLTLLSPNNWIAFTLALVCGGIFSVLIEIAVYRPLLLKNAKRLYLVIAGLGLTIVAENMVIVTIGGRFMSYPLEAFVSKPVNIFGASIGVVDLQILIISMLALAVVELYIKYTKDGLAIRGASFNLDYTSLMGVNVDRLMMKVFVIAGCLAGIAGYFFAIKYTAYPQLGQLAIKAFICAVLGGLGSMTGAVVGALIIGVAETFVSGYISSSMRDIFTFTLLVIVLIYRPTGIMGKSSEDKA